MRKISLSALTIATNPAIAGMLRAMAATSSRSAVKALNVAQLVDNSGGAAGVTLPVTTLDRATNAVGAVLASRATFNAALAKIDDAVAVLADHLAPVLAALSGKPLTGWAPGDVAVAGTIPAMDVTVGAGVDGSANNALLRVEANVAIVKARNDISTLMRAYNFLANVTDNATLRDNSGGESSADLVISGVGQAATVVAAANVATSDLALAASVDAQLAKLAVNVATLANACNVELFAAGKLNAEAIIVTV